ncbi:MAG: hypothetical protein ACKOW9_05260 [Candidatus Paceibacterota bacterium]
MTNIRTPFAWMLAVTTVGWIVLAGITFISVQNNARSEKQSQQMTDMTPSSFRFRREVFADEKLIAQNESLPEKGIKIAFVADQSLNRDARDVLRLVGKEGAEALTISGDFDYANNPVAWVTQVNSILGEEFPLFGSIGNHDLEQVWEYQSILATRAKTVGAACTGNIGVKAHCLYKGVQIVTTAPGLVPDTTYPGYIKNTLEASPTQARVCSFHLNSDEYQAGGHDIDAITPDIYDACRNGGAWSISGHSHNYLRTRGMTDFSTQTVSAGQRDVLEVGSGLGFHITNGLGGRERYLVTKSASTSPYIAKVFGDAPGALFCIFKASGTTCEFKNIKGEIKDSFKVLYRN